MQKSTLHSQMLCMALLMGNDFSHAWSGKLRGSVSQLFHRHCCGFLCQMPSGLVETLPCPTDRSPYAKSVADPFLV